MEFGSWLYNTSPTDRVLDVIYKLVQASKHI